MAIFTFPFSPGIWLFHSQENGNEKFAGIPGAQEMSAREWKPYFGSLVQHTKHQADKPSQATVVLAYGVNHICFTADVYVMVCNGLCTQMWWIICLECS